MRKRELSVLLLAAMLLPGCESSKSGQFQQPTQETINALGRCKKTAPDIEIIFDPLNGYYLFEGPDAAKMRRCLVEKEGWKEVGPPQYKAGTMVPPNLQK